MGKCKIAVYNTPSVKHVKTNAKKTKKAIQTILAVLKEAGFTQKDFATMIGVSVDTVKSWTRSKPFEVSPAFRMAITLSTGAVVQPDGSVASFMVLPFIKLGLLTRPANFTKEDFDSWRNRLCPSTESVADRAGDFAALLIKQLFRDAVKPVRGKRFRLPGVVDSFNRWFMDAAIDFKISVLETKKMRELEPGFMTLDQMRMYLFSTGIGQPLDELDPQDTTDLVVKIEKEIAKLRKNALKENPPRKDFLDMLDEMSAKLEQTKKPVSDPTVSAPNDIPVARARLPRHAATKAGE